MEHLKDVPSHRLLIECETCRRRGSYLLDRLKARHGESCGLRILLDLMRARCSRQPCVAQLFVPLQLDLDQSVMPSGHFDIEIWMTDGAKEMTVGRVWGRAIADAAFERAIALWPHSIITMRYSWMVVRTHDRDKAAMRERQGQILKSLGLGRSSFGTGEG